MTCPKKNQPAIKKQILLYWSGQAKPRYFPGEMDTILPSTSTLFIFRPETQSPWQENGTPFEMVGLIGACWTKFTKRKTEKRENTLYRIRG